MSWKKWAFAEDVPANFTDLDDTPAAYTGEAGKFAKVKATEDGLEFGVAALLSDTVPNTIEPDDPASEGVATEAARQDHEHAIVAAQPTGAVAEGASAAEGTGTSFVREDHVHECPATWAPSAHNTSHEDGGADEISVAALSGELADPQPPKAHAANHKDAGADEILLHELGEPTDNVEFAQKQALGIVLPNSTIASPPHPGTEVAGETFYATDDNHAYVWVPA